MKSPASRKPPGLRVSGNSRRNATADTPASGVALARQWASADVFSTALAACICAGGFHAPIDANAVAQDLLIYLEDKYRGAGQTALAGFVAQALQQPCDFGDWLAALDSAELQPQDHALLIGDLSTTLDSMSGRRGFACT